MSDAAPKNWEESVTSNGPGWILKTFTNPITAIVTVVLPFFRPGDGFQNTKQSRETLLKVSAGLNNDKPVLHFRSEYNDNGEKDPYYPYAPGWSSLSGGYRPRLLASPMNVCKWMTEAATCVPLISEVKHFIVENDVNTEITLEQLMALAIPMKSIPVLRQPVAIAASSAAPPPAAAPTASAAASDAPMPAASAPAPAAVSSGAGQPSTNTNSQPPPINAVDNEAVQADRARAIEVQRAQLAEAEAKQKLADEKAKAKEDKDIMQKQIASLTATVAKLLDEKNTNAGASTPHQDEANASSTPKRDAAKADLPSTEARPRPKRSCNARA